MKQWIFFLFIPMVMSAANITPPSGGASSADLATKLSTSNVVQTTGTSTTDVMSQNAVEDALSTKMSIDGSNATSDFINNVTTGVQVTAYAYLTVPSNTVLSTTNWYYFQGVFTNEDTRNVSFGAAGITVDVDCDVEVEWKTCGQANQTTSIQIAMAKNASFNTNGIMTNGVLLQGACDLQQADTGSAADGWAGLHSLWQGSLAAGESLSLIIRTDDASPAVTWTALSAAASLHSLVAVGLTSDAPVTQTVTSETNTVPSNKAVLDVFNPYGVNGGTNYTAAIKWDATNKVFIVTETAQ
jgi:hypothetical protein